MNKVLTYGENKREIIMNSQDTILKDLTKRDTILKDTIELDLILKDMIEMDMIVQDTIRKDTRDQEPLKQVQQLAKYISENNYNYSIRIIIMCMIQLTGYLC